ncbi:carboxylesterase/lipase family protein [Kineobactrum salinum]|uniref:Carboxylesterase family protein n=1 Tax=Kineobactrum salinum TaxID=2708301 RepID=A0A6C0TYQ6_9GAMM|nr:carboxylesterase family protein [Kineobactrum salinum]QIB64906.1 carboxylesterase family protein [Kineobactrum salinum]
MSGEIVSTNAGQLRGIRLAEGVRGFRGIPYATPPVGPLRWRPPGPAIPWPGLRDAQTFGMDAVQVSGIRESRAPGMSEDCLYLNVWAPEQPHEGGWPVIIWSGGGGFTTGGGAFVEEDLTRLAARGAVVVSFNYRLGIFGFLAHPALTAESPVGSSGNYGLMDHVAALKWVRENIAAFGGDSSRITYMAESSGAAAGLLLLSTPHENKLFDRAIFLSPGSTSPLLSLAEAEHSAVGLNGSADNITAEDLRAIAGDELLAKAKQLAAPPSNLSVARPLRPVVDGWLITDDKAYTAGRFDPVPIIIGSNEDEGRFFTRRMSIAAQDDYSSYLSSTFGARAAAAAELYPAGSTADVAEAVAAAYGDVSINYPIERLVNAFAERQPQTFRFVYTYRHGETTQPPTHSEEAGTFLDTRPHITPADADMAEKIGSYMLAFAENGNPNAAGLPEWPAYRADTQRYLTLDLPLSTGSHWRADYMRFVSG